MTIHEIIAEVEAGRTVVLPSSWWRKLVKEMRHATRRIAWDVQVEKGQITIRELGR